VHRNRVEWFRVYIFIVPCLFYFVISLAEIFMVDIVLDDFASRGDASGCYYFAPLGLGRGAASVRSRTSAIKTAIASMIRMTSVSLVFHVYIMKPGLPLAVRKAVAVRIGNRNAARATMKPITIVIRCARFTVGPFSKSYMLGDGHVHIENVAQPRPSEARPPS
jgi:hypothetical protein